MTVRKRLVPRASRARLEDENLLAEPGPRASRARREDENLLAEPGPRASRARREDENLPAEPGPRASRARREGSKDALRAVAASLEAAERWELRLYVAGWSPRSVAAFANLKRLCETHLRGKYRIDIIDLLTRPELARVDQIVAIPTLIRRLPPPLKRIIGDLSNKERTLIGMELVPGP